MRYSVCYKVKIKNLESKEKVINLILPYPLETSYQKILNLPTIIPKTGSIKKEVQYQNKYTHWKAILEPNEEKVFEYNLKILVKPRGDGTKSLDKLNKKNLKSDKFVDVNKRIINLSKNLTENIDIPEDKVAVLNNYVINNLEYGNPIEGLYTSNDALSKEKVDCGGFDTLLAALCIAQKIPSRIISGFFAGDGSTQIHAWLEIYSPRQGWIPADPSIEKLAGEGRSKKFAKLGFIKDDRIALSMGHNLKIRIGNKFINLDILQNPFILFNGKIDYSYNFETRIIK